MIAQHAGTSAIHAVADTPIDGWLAANSIALAAMAMKCHGQARDAKATVVASAVGTEMEARCVFRN